MSSTMEEQSTSAPSVESPQGATTTDPTGTTNKLEKAVDQLNAHMDRMSTFLGQLCQSIPTGECYRNVREAGSHDPTGTNEPKRKRQRDSESFSSDEEAESPCMKFNKHSDAISVTASEEEVQNLLNGISGGSSHRVRTLFCEQNSRLFPDFFQTIFFIFQTQDNSEILHSPRRNNCLNYENNE